jgi:hypothetical protein
MPTGLGFNIRETEPVGGGRDPWPEDTYHVYITKASVVPTKDGMNGRAVFGLTAIDGVKKGETFDYGMNLFHSNQQTKRIAQRELTALAYVCQKIDATTVEEFIGSSAFLVRIGPQMKPSNPEDAGKYSEVKHVMYLDGTKPGEAPAPQQAASTPALPAQAQQPTQQTFQPTQQQQPAQQALPAFTPAGGGGGFAPPQQQQPAQNFQPAQPAGGFQPQQMPGGGFQQQQPAQNGGAAQLPWMPK